VDIIIPCGANALALLRLKQGHLGNRIVAHLQTDAMIHGPPEPGGEPGLGDVPPEYEPLIRLLKLISIVGIIEEKGEVRKQTQAVVGQIGVRLGETFVALI
jgi:hypothetical protein